MLNNENTNLKTILLIMIALSKEDGDINGRELLYILDAGKSFGMSDKEVRDLIYLPQDTFELPKTEQERMNILYHLLFLSRQDSLLKIQEENFIYHYGFKLGFNESMIRDMIELFKKKQSSNIGPTELIDIIKKYLN